MSERLGPVERVVFSCDECRWLTDRTFRYEGEQVNAFYCTRKNRRRKLHMGQYLTPSWCPFLDADGKVKSD